MMQRQQRSRARAAFHVGLFAMLAACTSAVDGESTQNTTEPLSGAFALAELDNQQLPADLGALPSKDGQQSTCRMIVGAGSLQLVGPDFRILYEVRESCGGSTINAVAGADGTFEQLGTALTLRADRGAGVSETYQGLIESTKIRITTPLHSFVFRR